jgi:methionyl-tRNA formyltransferase
MGTPVFAVPTLERSVQAGHEVVAVFTQPDRPKGRGQKDAMPPVKDAALRLGVPVHQPERIRRPEVVEQLRGLAPEAMVVVGYGQIIPQSILDIPPQGIINVHASLLPKYRGAAPIQWALLNGDTETGVTIMQMDEQMDTGAILAMEKIPIRSDDNAQTLHDRLAELGAALLLKTIPDYVAGKIQPRPQPSAGVSYAPKIKKSDGQIDWQQPAETIANRVRAMIPWPGAFTRLSNPSPSALLKIWEAEVVARSGSAGEILQADKNGLVISCGTNALHISLLQAEGGRRMSAQEFLTGHQLQAGQKLG